MNIIIWCDQLQCIYNAASRVHHDHSTDRCEHWQPLLKRMGAMNGLPESYFCESKRVYAKQDKNKN